MSRYVSNRIIPVTAVVVVAGMLSACSTSPQDFKTEGEKFLQSPELAQEAGYTFSRAQCKEPASTTVGTRFTCTATDNDGDDWEFVVEITGERELTVISGDLIN
jgi:hypothetical protein